MAFDKEPTLFFGPGYALTSSEIKLSTGDHANYSLGTFTTAFAVDNTLTFAADPELRVGDVIQVTTSAADLPAGLVVLTDYIVSAVDATSLIITLEGVILTDDGTGTHSGEVLPPLAGLTDAEANATTGDHRKITAAILHLLEHSLTKVTTGDESTKVTGTKRMKDSGNKLILSYNFTVETVKPTNLEVADE